ncbi:MAG: TVP38/TMEM64 family protein [Gemmatimonadetes bacterium]|nr:VTT domain-containing protein [Gemmatimonadota bacterium]NNF14744.1 TVP38/TMEM64 family protein [Gemmatimonadota bacterium]NNL29951.1 TVP38/TMEM64 family protein [Gemmatimonadota bacterium]
MADIFANVETWLAAMGVWAYVVAPLVMAAVSILPVPAEAPAMVNGMLFGAVVGSLITWLGAMAGAWISYEIARSWGRSLARRMVRQESLERLDNAADQAGWWGLLALRFVPVVAFTALNWGAGLCDVPRRRFLWTTALGIAPGVVLFTTSGVGLSAIWRRSPPVAAAFVLGAVVLAVWWERRRRATRTAAS